MEPICRGCVLIRNILRAKWIKKYLVWMFFCLVDVFVFHTLGYSRTHGWIAAFRYSRILCYGHMQAGSIAESILYMVPGHKLSTSIFSKFLPGHGLHWPWAMHWCVRSTSPSTKNCTDSCEYITRLCRGNVTTVNVGDIISRVCLEQHKSWIQP